MITTIYIQMFARPERRVPAPREGLLVLHARRPSVPYFLYLYDRVGREYNWTSRRQHSDAAIAAVIQHPLNELHVLFVEGEPAGFIELDRRVPDEVELVQFGLMPEFIGQGLGRWFLQWTIDKVWSYGPRRFWLHTCTKDHPAALPNYLKAGFEIYHEETKP